MLYINAEASSETVIWLVYNQMPSLNVYFHGKRGMHFHMLCFQQPTDRWSYGMILTLLIQTIPTVSINIFKSQLADLAPADNSCSTSIITASSACVIYCVCLCVL